MKELKRETAQEWNDRYSANIAQQILSFFHSFILSFLAGIRPLNYYLLNGWFEVFPVGLAMFSRMEVSASMFFIR